MPKDQPNALTEAYYSNAYTTVVLNGANVTLCKPTPDGIQLVSQAPVVTTSSYGSYSVEVDYSAITVESGQPLLVCASNANGTFTLLSMIPSNRVQEGGVVELNVTPETTAVATILCPAASIRPQQERPATPSRRRA